MKFKYIVSKSRLSVFARIDLKNATITLQDGTGTPVTLEATIGEGNFTYSEKRNMDYLLDRGNLDDVREGDQVPVDVSFDFVWEYLTGEGGTGDPGTIEDFLKLRGAYSANLSSDTTTAGACRPASVDIVVLYEPTPSACGDKETITFLDFRYEDLSHDLSAGTVSCTGRCNVTEVSSVRAAQ